MTRPEISLDTLEGILSRQGGVPMTPRDLATAKQALEELRESIPALRIHCNAPVRTQPIIYTKRGNFW